MHAVRRPLLLLCALAVAATGALVGVPGTAAAAGETVVGTLVQAWPEYEHAAEARAHGDEGPLSWIETDDGDAVRVPTDDLQAAADVPVGATVEVTVGRRVADQAAEHGMDDARAVLAATVVDEPATAPADPAPTDEVTVALVAPRGTSPDGTTAAAVVGAVNAGVKTFWAGQSDGAIQLRATQASGSWLTASSGCGDPMALWDEVAQRVHWTRGTGKHLMLYLPRTASGCAYGLGEVGSSLDDGGRFYVRDTSTAVIAHELGHNFGLGHSSELQCNGTVEAPSCDAARYTAPYNDWYDVMGYSWQQLGTLNVAQADRLGLLPTAEKASRNTWDAAADYTLAPVSAATGTRAVELVDPAGVEYWLEYRQASGQDAWLGTGANLPGLQAGVLLRRSDLRRYAGDSSLLLDGTPSTSATWPYDLQTAFPQGTAVAVGRGDFTVTVQSVTAGAAVVRITPGASPVGVKYAATGGPAGPLGAPTKALACGLRGGGCFRVFTGGSVYWSPSTPAVTIGGSLRARWGTLGWETGLLGYPTAEPACGLPDGGCAQDFQGGTLIGSGSTPVRFLRGSIKARWTAAGGAGGSLGYPLADEVCGLRGGGCFQRFQNGSVYWSAATGARIVRGALRDRWGALGWETGALGYPVADAVCGLPATGCRQDFQGGSLLTSGATPVRRTYGAIRDAYIAGGGPAGALGYPTTDARCGLREGGCFQVFQGGSVYWSAATGARVVGGAVRDRWGALGWETGRLGYPTGDATCGLPDGGCTQTFQGGTLAGSTSTGVRLTYGAVRTRWLTSGGAGGALGLPTRDAVCGLRDGGCFQTFQGGSVYWSAATGAHTVAGPLRDSWAAAGWETGRYGYPAEEPRTVGADTVQRFQRGTLTWVAATGVVRGS